jgi:hypothetical protein
VSSTAALEGGLLLLLLPVALAGCCSWKARGAKEAVWVAVVVAAAEAEGDGEVEGEPLSPWVAAMEVVGLRVGKRLTGAVRVTMKWERVEVAEKELLQEEEGEGVEELEGGGLAATGVPSAEALAEWLWEGLPLGEGLGCAELLWEGVTLGEGLGCAELLWRALMLEEGLDRGERDCEGVALGEPVAGGERLLLRVVLADLELEGESVEVADTRLLRV